VRFSIDQKELLKSLTIVQKGVSSKTTLPALKGIYVEAVDQYLKLVATDLDIGIEHFTRAEIEEEGVFVADARLLLNIVRKMPSRPIHFMMAEHRQLTITCDHIVYTLHLLEREEFPELPIVNPETSFQIPQDLFKEMVGQTIFCASQDESKPSLLGLRCEMRWGTGDGGGRRISDWHLAAVPSNQTWKQLLLYPLKPWLNLFRFWRKMKNHYRYHSRTNKWFLPLKIRHSFQGELINLLYNLGISYPNHTKR
jgi:hypothetical protein